MRFSAPFLHIHKRILKNYQFNFSAYSAFLKPTCTVSPFTIIEHFINIPFATSSCNCFSSLIVDLLQYMTYLSCTSSYDGSPSNIPPKYIFSTFCASLGLNCEILFTQLPLASINVRRLI